ncbi:MAG: peptidylprolyl isomerase, partial [Thermoanaerobaculia bacterium]
MGLIVAVAAAAADKGSGAPRVRLATSMGDIVIELDPEKAPKTAENFL